MNWIEEKPLESSFENKEVVQVREWMATMMLMVIPIINIVMLFYWAFSDKDYVPASKVNWARGTLIVLAAFIFSFALVIGTYGLVVYFNPV